MGSVLDPWPKRVVNTYKVVRHELVYLRRIVFFRQSIELIASAAILLDEDGNSSKGKVIHIRHSS